MQFYINCRYDRSTNPRIGPPDESDRYRVVKTHGNQSHGDDRRNQPQRRHYENPAERYFLLNSSLTMRITVDPRGLTLPKP